MRAVYTSSQGPKLIEFRRVLDVILNLLWLAQQAIRPEIDQETFPVTSQKLLIGIDH